MTEYRTVYASTPAELFQQIDLLHGSGWSVDYEPKALGEGEERVYWTKLWREARTEQRRGSRSVGNLVYPATEASY